MHKSEIGKALKNSSFPSPCAGQPSRSLLTRRRAVLAYSRHAGASTRPASLAWQTSWTLTCSPPTWASPSCVRPASTCIAWSVEKWVLYGRAEQLMHFHRATVHWWLPLSSSSPSPSHCAQPCSSWITAFTEVAMRALPITLQRVAWAEAPTGTFWSESHPLTVFGTDGTAGRPTVLLCPPSLTAACSDLGLAALVPGATAVYGFALAAGGLGFALVRAETTISVVTLGITVAGNAYTAALAGVSVQLGTVAAGTPLSPVRAADDPAGAPWFMRPWGPLLVVAAPDGSWFAAFDTVAMTAVDLGPAAHAATFSATSASETGDQCQSSVWLRTIDP